MKKAVQYFSKEALERSQKLTPEQIVNFLENFRILHYQNQKVKSQLISMKIPIPLLEAFKFKASLENIPYQTKIKKLMEEWLN